jgi:hypothetical protein
VTPESMADHRWSEPELGKETLGIDLVGIPMLSQRG